MSKQGSGLSRLFRGAATALVMVFAIVGVLLAALALLSETDESGVTRVGDRPVLIVLSDSMTPTFKAGDILVEKSVDGRADELEVGDVITFHVPHADELVTHRIVKVNETPNGVSYRTQGDANNMVDRTPVKPENVVGTYSWHAPSVGYALNAVQTPKGLMLVILIPALLLLIPTLARMWRAAGDGEAEPGPSEAPESVGASTR